MKSGRGAFGGAIHRCPRQRGISDEHTLPGRSERSGAYPTAALLNGGKHAARKIKRAQILLAADAGVSDEVIASTVSVGGSTVYRTKRRFVEGNLEAALSEEARPGAARKLSGKETALLVATACSNPPEGRKRWTLDLLAGEMVRLTEHDDRVARDGAPAPGRGRSEAVATGHVVHSAGRRHLCRADGGRA